MNGVWFWLKKINLLGYLLPFQKFSPWELEILGDWAISYLVLAYIILKYIFRVQEAELLRWLQEVRVCPALELKKFLWLLSCHYINIKHSSETKYRSLVPQQWWLHNAEQSVLESLWVGSKICTETVRKKKVIHGSRGTTVKICTILLTNSFVQLLME